MKRIILFFISISVLANQTLAETRLLPNGLKSGALVFSLIEREGKESDLYLIDFKSQRVLPLVVNPGVDEYPTFSPDGKFIAFYSDRSGDREIYIASRDGSGLQRLTRSPGVDEDPSWSPDGGKIAFHSERLGRGSNLFMMNRDGSSLEALTQNGSKNTVPKWSPDGTRIIFSTSAHWPGWDLAEINLSGKKITDLTSGFRTFCRGNYAPDGRSYLFSSGMGRDIELWVGSFNGAKPQQLTSRGGKNYDGVWTRDGKKIFFVGELHRGAGDYQLFLLDLSNGEVSQITEGDGAVRYLSLHE